MEMAVTRLAILSVVTEKWKLANNVIMVLPTRMSFLMLAAPTAETQDVVMVLEIPTSNAILVPTLLNANHVLSDAEMVSWSLEKSVTAVFTTQMINQMDVVPIADFPTAVMELLTVWKSATTDLRTEMLPMLAEHGAESPSVVTELLTLNITRTVMTETLLTVMVVIPVAKLSVVTVVLILEKNVMLEQETLIPLQAAVVSTVNYQHAAMERLISVRNATMEQMPFMLQTDADQIALFPLAEMELLITTLVKFVIRVIATPGQLLMDVLLTAHQTFAVNQCT